jgi:hypothetical protein
VIEHTLCVLSSYAWLDLHACMTACMYICMGKCIPLGFFFYIPTTSNSPNVPHLCEHPPTAYQHIHTHTSGKGGSRTGQAQQTTERKHGQHTASCLRFFRQVRKLPIRESLQVLARSPPVYSAAAAAAAGHTAGLCVCSLNFG